MSLVTLIKKLNTAERDAVVQIEDWALPKEAYATGKVDEAGRAIFTLFKPEVVKVETVAKNDETVVETDANTILNKVETEVEKVYDEVKDEANTILSKVENFFHHKANT